MSGPKKNLSSLLLRSIRAVFGTLQWQPPQWLKDICNYWQGFFKHAKNHKIITSLFVIVILLGALAGYGTFYYYSNRSLAYRVIFTTIAPEVSNYEQKPLDISPLIVNFYDSVAPIDQIDKKIEQDITISPQIDGQWYWADDATLKFTPSSDWPINTTYQVHFNQKGLFAASIILDHYNFSFITPPFSLKTIGLRLYEDPLEPMSKKVVGTVRFSHPVDRKDFATHIRFELSKGLEYKDKKADNLPQVFFSKNGLEAYIHSSQLQLPLENSTASLFLSKGIRADAGGNSLQQDVKSSVIIPGRYQLSFETGKISFVDNQEGDPEPVFMFESSSPISDAEIENKLDAWQLPKNNNHSQWFESEIDENLLARSTKLTLTHIPTSEGQSTVHAFKIKAQPESQIYIRLAKDIESVSGYFSKKNVVLFNDIMPNYPKQLSFLSQGALLSLKGERKIGILARGVSDAEAEIARILPQQLNHLVDQLDGSFKQPIMDEWDFDKLVERQTYKVSLANIGPEKSQYSNINLSPYLDYANGRKGIFVLRLTDNKYDNTTLGTTNNVRDIRFIIVTDIGIIAKRSLDGSHKLFIQSISTGNPIANAKVELIGLNGLSVMTDYTDEMGYVHFDNANKYKRENSPLMYVVTKDDDQSFLPYVNAGRELDYSRFAVGGQREKGDAKNTLRAFMFTDRGLYQPGENINIGMIIRANDWSGNLKGLPVILSIIDPRGQEIKKQTLTLSNEAFEDFSFKSDANAPAGTYSASLYLPQDTRENQQRFLGNVDFSIRDFEPDRMKVTASLTDNPLKAWLKPEEVEAKVTAMHLFGAAASDRRVSLEMTLSPAFASFKNWQDYRFYIAKTLDESTEEKRQDQQTDNQGVAIFDLELNRFTARAYNLQIYAQVFEKDSGKNVAAQAQTMVSSANIMLGVKSTDDLNYINKADMRKVHWVAIGQDLKTQAVDNLTREHIEIYYVSVLVKQNDGTYRYQSQKREKLIDVKDFSVGQNGTEDILDTSRPGHFIIKIKQGQETLNQISYNVVGNENASRNLERNAELKLTLDKNSYVSGENIAISINAPYKGSGLITIERDNIYAFKWFKADTTSSVQYINLPKGLEGNAYINVQFVRSPSSDEIYMSPLSYGIAPFSINLDNRRINANIETPKTIEPNEIFPVKIKLNQPARVVVYGVDEGILQVARYQQPLPLNFFFNKKALEVTTSQILDLILPEFSKLAAAAPGGDSEASLAMHLNPFKRKNKPPVVMWSGIMSLPEGETQINWQAPDYFNGKLHFFVVAVNDQHIGAAQSTLDVQSPIVITPNIPTFVAPGDKVKISAGVFNTLQEKTTLDISLQTDDGITLENNNPIPLEIGSNGEKSANFTVNIGNMLGNHELKFISHLPDGKIISLTETLSVRPLVERRVTIATGLFHNNQLELTPERKLYSQYRNVEFGASASPLVWGQGLSQYLDNYGYICTEQMVSKAMPALILGNSHQPDSIQAIQKALNILIARQNSEGGFGLWNATLDSEPFISLYAIDFLIDARERGFSVPDYQWKKSLAYLEATAKSTTSGLYGIRNRAYAIYLLTRTGIVTSNELTEIAQQLNQYYTEKDYENDVLALYMAASYKLMKQDVEANALFAKQKWALLSKDWNSDSPYMDALTHDAIMFSLKTQYASGQDKIIPEDVMLKLGENLRLQKYSSLSAALLIRAFDIYDQFVKDNIHITTIGETFIGEKYTLNMEGRPPRANIANDIKKLVLEKDQSKSAGYYFLSEAGYDNALPKKPVINGLEVSHEYMALDGTPIDQIAVGEEFLVSVRYRLVDKNFYGGFALVDLLPGGTEIVYQSQQNNVEDDEYYDEEYSTAEQSFFPIGVAKFSDWEPDFIDTRDDRVILYGNLDGNNVKTFTYRLRAVSVGDYQTPPAFIESMYQPEFHGLSMGGKLKIVENEPVK